MVHAIWVNAIDVYIDKESKEHCDETKVWCTEKHDLAYYTFYNHILADAWYVPILLGKLFLKLLVGTPYPYNLLSTYSSF